MTLQLTVVGLDQAGVSFGLALASVKDNLVRIGHDPAQKRTNKVETLGAFDKIHFRLNEAVRDADIVLLSLPADQVEITLKDMAEDLKAGAIVIDTSRACLTASQWASQSLPDGAHFISMIPSINGHYLRENASDVNLPRADLFANCEMIIATTHETHADAMKMASEITTITGAHSCLTDVYEADGLFARIDLMPKLASAALLLATLDQPGWSDAKRLASRAYAQSTDTIQFFNELVNPAAEIFNNKENALRALDGLTSALANIREQVESNDNKRLDAVLLDLKEGQAEWSDLRYTGDWDKEDRDELAKPGSMLKRMFGDPSKLLKK
jgi:prephenate dehydrogenase